MLEVRVIPCLQLSENCLVKTIQFKNPQYIGDPLNTCRIFNELEVDEMIILDIRATLEHRKYDLLKLKNIASECFMPLAYGGGITTIEDARKIFSLGFEKIIINSSLYQDEGNLVKIISNEFGSQSVIASIDVKKDFLGRYRVYSNSGTIKQKITLKEAIKMVEKLGAGEIMLTNISLEGTWKGFDIELIRKVSEHTILPLIVHGGAGCKKDVEDAINLGRASGVALGNMVVYQKKGMGVLINYSHDYSFLDNTSD